MQLRLRPAGQARYNALPLLDDAQAELRRKRTVFKALLADARRVLTALGASDGAGLGVFLLHRHWALRAKEVMLEVEQELDDGSPIWVTAATQIARARGMPAAPSRWAIDTAVGKLVPLELSTDSIVIRSNIAFRQDPRVLDALALLIAKHGLQDTVGLQIIPRKSLIAGAHSDFVETNDGGLSVVKGENLTPQERARCVKVCWSLAIRKAGNMVCCYCSHYPGGGCRHPKPDPPVCSPHGCVKPDPNAAPKAPTRKRRKKRKPVVDPRARRVR